MMNRFRVTIDTIGRLSASYQTAAAESFFQLNMIKSRSRFRPPLVKNNLLRRTLSQATAASQSSFIGSLISSLTAHLSRMNLSMLFLRSVPTKTKSPFEHKLRSVVHGSFLSRVAILKYHVVMKTIIQSKDLTILWKL